MGNYIVVREAIDIEYHALKLRYQMKLICTIKIISIVHVIERTIERESLCG